MNPYLEQTLVWNDFHTDFVVGMREAIAAQVAPAYFVRVQEHLYVHEWASPFARGNVSVSERPGSEPRAGGGAATLTAPMELIDPAPSVDHERVPYLEVLTRDDRRVVTVIELLSPTNKYAGADRVAFLKKRSTLLNRAVHYLEIDLLRGGPRMPIRDLPACDYYVYLSRIHRRPRWSSGPCDCAIACPKSPFHCFQPMMTRGRTSRTC